MTSEVDEAAARIPSALAALAALASILLITLWGRKLFGEREALRSGIVLASYFSFIFYARRASADSRVQLSPYRIVLAGVQTLSSLPTAR